ncbi:MAG: DNA-binding protein [Clostridia bacterium]|nr:DNA-binding protein [Clostridia bacterium]
MFEKNMRIAYLLDFYEDLLDPHIGNVMRAYYDDDLSLSEIASGEGISRQGVRHLIKKGEEALEFFESNLALAKRHEELTDAAEALIKLSDSLDKSNRTDDAAELRRIAEVITKGNQDVPKSN